MTRSRHLRDLERASQLSRQANKPTTVLHHLRSDRITMSPSPTHLHHELDFKEAPLRATWPHSPPLPISTHDAFPLAQPPLLPNRGFHIQRVRSLCGRWGIQTLGVEIALRIPADDLDEDMGNWVPQLRERTVLPPAEYLTMLIVLDFRRYGARIPGALKGVRRLLMRNNDTAGLAIEFLDQGCDGYGYPYTSLSSVRDWDAQQAWRSEVFQAELRSALRGRRWSVLSCFKHFVSVKAMEDGLDAFWRTGDDGGWPAVRISAYDADEREWWDGTLPALRKWMKSDEFFRQYGTRFDVALTMNRRGFRR